MTKTTTLSARFRISIPKSIRTARQWEAWRKLAFVPKDAGVLLVAVPQTTELAGIAEGADPTGFRDREDRA